MYVRILNTFFFCYVIPFCLPFWYSHVVMHYIFECAMQSMCTVIGICFQLLLISPVYHLQYAVAIVFVVTMNMSPNYGYPNEITRQTICLTEFIVIFIWFSLPIWLFDELCVSEKHTVVVDWYWWLIDKVKVMTIYWYVYAYACVYLLFNILALSVTESALAIDAVFVFWIRFFVAVIWFVLAII